MYATAGKRAANLLARQHEQLDAQDEFAFQYICDAYYLNVNLQGRQEFKLADMAWSNDTTFGGIGGTASIQCEKALVLWPGGAPGGVGNLDFDFHGEHTLRLAFPGGHPTLGIGVKSLADPRQQAVTNPAALSLQHDSRALADKSPFGAVKAGATVYFAVNSSAGVDAIALVIGKRWLEGNQDVLDYSEIARVQMTQSNAGAGRIRWKASHVFGAVGVLGYYFEARIGGGTFVYQNNPDAVHWTRENGSNGVGMVEEDLGSANAIRRYRLTVYSPDYTVPAWASDAIYYYIFPERFRNGDPANDPKPGIDRYHDQAVEFHQDWTDKPHKPGSGDGSEAIYNNDFFGGDIAGIIEKLDYIAGLGANTLYITPLFTASSNHKYDTADYRNIDPHFGSNDDFSRLTDDASKRGIRVILDASLNHTGSDSIYFDRYAKYPGQGAFDGGKICADSPYADWYSFDARQVEPEKHYKGWVGINDLPELNKASRSFRQFA